MKYIFTILALIFTLTGCDHSEGVDIRSLKLEPINQSLHSNDKLQAEAIATLKDGSTLNVSINHGII